MLPEAGILPLAAASIKVSESPVSARSIADV